MKTIKQTVAVHCLSVALVLSCMAATLLAQSPVKVNVLNFVRAETPAQFDRALDNAGGINILGHLREPTPLDKQKCHSNEP